MVTRTTTNPINKLKKLRSWDELRTRGGQAVSAYGEKFGLGGNIPTDAEFVRLIDKDSFNGLPVTADTLMQEFYLNADERFFPVFRHDARSVERFRGAFPDSASRFVEKAERICDGRIDLLGFENIDIGRTIDWHLEPVSGIRSPLKHWKQFDESNTAEAGDRKIIWELNRHQHFFTLGLAFWLTGDELFAAVFADQIESWMEQNPPGIGVNWSSSLEVAFRAMSWIWAFQFFRLSERFTPELFQKAAKYLYLHGRHIEKYLSTYYSPNTHLTGEALGLYYLGTQLPMLQRAEHWRTVAESILFEEVEKQIFDDGVYFEQSTWYQRYTIDFYIHFVILKSLANDEPGGAPADALETRLGSALRFLMYVTRPDGSVPIIGDDDGGRALPLSSAKSDDFRGTLHAGVELLGRDDLRRSELGRSEESFWLLGSEARFSVLDDDLEFGSASAIFPAGGYAVMRDGWLVTDNYMLIDCGPVGSLAGGHGHADALSVEVAIEGRTLLIDSGTYSYHESAETRDHYRSTAAHNSVSVDGRSSSETANTFSWRSRAAATIKKWISNDRFDYFDGEHDGFQRFDDPATHRRSVLFLKNDYIVIRDLVRAQTKHDIDIAYHFSPGTKCNVDPHGAGGDHWRIVAFGDGMITSKTEDFISNMYGRRSLAPVLHCSASRVGTQEFFTFILPANSTDRTPFVKELPIDGARAFAIEYRNYIDLVVYNDELRNMVCTDLFDTNFEISWARVVVGNDRPQEYVLVGGNRFRVEEQDLLQCPGDVDHAVIRQLGSEFYVATQSGRFRVSIP